MAKKTLKINEKFHLTLVSPDKVLFEDDVMMVMAPGSIQEIAILPDHTPLYSELTKGDVSITKLNKEIEKIPIDSGVIRVKNNQVSIITGF